MSNGKLPWGKFYWSDWDRDTALASCSLAAQGAWMRLLCAMQEQDTYEVRGTVENFARILRCSPPEAAQAIDELAVTGTADLYALKPRGRPQLIANINDDLFGLYSVTCRRMKRECNARETIRKRVQKHRLAKVKRSCNGVETDLKRSCNTIESESESESESDTEITVVNELSSSIEETTYSNQKKEKSTSLTEVFDFWREVLNHPRAILDAKRRRLVTARLAEGFTVDQLKAAITGCSRSAFHQGGNDGGAVYDDLSLICRDAAHVEQFISRGDTTLEKPKQLSKNSQRLLDSLEGVARRAGFENGGFDSGNTLLPRLTVLR